MSSATASVRVGLSAPADEEAAAAAAVVRGVHHLALPHESWASRQWSRLTNGALVALEVAGFSRPELAALHGAAAAALWTFAIVTGVVGAAASQGRIDSVSPGIIRSLNLVSVHLAFLHAAALLAIGLAHAATRSSALFLCRRYVRRFLASVIHGGAAIAYYYGAFRPLLCASGAPGGDGACGTLEEVWAAHMVFVAGCAALQGTAIFLFGYNYLKRRSITWVEMNELERIYGFHPSLVHGVSCSDVRAFCKHWIDKSPNEIVEELPQRTDAVMRALTRDLDATRNGAVCFEELAAFAAAHGLARIEDVLALWHALADPRTGAVGRDGVRQALYDVAFARKRLAMLLLTDAVVVSWAIMFLNGIVYGACGVVALQLLGYDSFGVGIDMLKVYIMVVTYALNNSANNLKFLLTMIVHRPFNIGDVLMLDAGQIAGAGSNAGVGGSLFGIAELSLSHATLLGSCRLQVPNTLLTVGCPVRNVSRGPMNDCVRLMLPLSTDAATAEVVAAAITEHARAKPYDLDPDAPVHCVWGAVEPGAKTLEVYWTYAPNVQDTQTAQRLMFGTRNAVLAAIWRTLRRDATVAASAYGGAFNAQVAARVKLD